MTTITLSDGSPCQLPDASRLAQANCGTPGVWRFDGAGAGPNVVITALIHGNEVCGACALAALLDSPPVIPRGSLTLVFCNLDAYARLNDANKAECRLVDEDFNRVWGRLESERRSSELDRAREILPFVANADVLLDLHSMTSPAPALGLVGLSWKNVEFGQRIGFPALLLRDAGHSAGLRLIDRAPYSTSSASEVAMLVECGEHFSRVALAAAQEAVKRTIAAFLLDEQCAPAEPQRVLEVTHAVTIESSAFEFTQEWPNMAIVPSGGTLIARDGDREVRTPYDDTYLVMPASERYRKPGLTAVRLARSRPGCGS